MLKDLRQAAERINKELVKRNNNLFRYKEFTNQFSENNFVGFKDIAKELWFIDGSNNLIISTSVGELHKVRVVAMSSTHKVEVIEGYVYINDSVEPLGALKRFDINGKNIDEYRENLERAVAKNKGLVVSDGVFVNGLAISKDNSVKLGDLPVSVALKKYADEWIYRDAIITPSYRIGFVRFKAYSRIYRFDYNDLDLAIDILSSLKNTVSIDTGYPIPLIEVHKLARISNEEAMRDKLLIRGMIKDIELIEDIHDYLE